MASEQNGSQFNPKYFGVGLIPGLASKFAPQATDDFFGGLKDLLIGKQGGTQRQSQFSQGSQDIMEQLRGLGLEGLKDPYKGFEPIEQQARTNFTQKTVPSIAERFGASTGGALSSPALSSQLGQAGAGLEGNLAALKSQYGLENRDSLMKLLGLGLQPEYGAFNQEQGDQEGLLQQLLPLLLQIGSKYFTGGF